MLSREPGNDQVRAAEIVAALCLATDVGMGFPLEHGLQSTLIAMRLCERPRVRLRRHCRRRSTPACSPTLAARRMRRWQRRSSAHRSPPTSRRSCSARRATRFAGPTPCTPVGSQRSARPGGTDRPPAASCRDDPQTPSGRHVRCGTDPGSPARPPVSTQRLFRYLTERWDGGGHFAGPPRRDPAPRADHPRCDRCRSPPHDWRRRTCARSDERVEPGTPSIPKSLPAYSTSLESSPLTSIPRHGS